MEPMEVAAALCANPVDIAAASRKEQRGGVPREPGLYAWWIRDTGLAGVPRSPHPTMAGWGALYVGIAPKGPSSVQMLRSRILGQHVGGNTGSSTFRYSLASLLGYRPVRRGAKFILTPQDNARLTQWQRDNILLSWAIHPRPWEVESEVIARLKPSLNLADNVNHPFRATMALARARFRQAAIVLAS